MLLLEAGPDYGAIDTDEGWRSLPGDLADGTRNSMTEHDWGYWAKPTPKQVPFVFPRGRVVGGSSAVNTCIALRGQPYDYDEWDLEEWSFDKCLPYFIRLEHDLDIVNAWHGSAGPLPIRRHPHRELTLWQQAFLEACEQLGFPRSLDANDPTQSGFGPHPMNKIDGKRISVAVAYLTGAVRRRANLDVRGDTLVRRVILEDGRVCAVEVESRGETLRIPTDRVVLSAGAIGTLGILLRSGIGPRAELARLGVTPVREIEPVGARLWDHPGAAMFFEPRHNISRTTDPVLQTALHYQAGNSSYANDMTLQPGSFVPLPIADFRLVSMMCAVGKPRGYGRIRFPSADPHAKPEIENRFLLDPDDLEAACEAMELAWLLGTSRPMAELARVIVPRERDFTNRTALRSWLPKFTGSGYHPCGTVPLGEATDVYGRVHGVEGLVVADASLFPTIPSSNIHLSVIMVGERIGEWLANGTLL